MEPATAARGDYATEASTFNESSKWLDNSGDCCLHGTPEATKSPPPLYSAYATATTETSCTSKALSGPTGTGEEHVHEADPTLRADAAPADSHPTTDDAHLGRRSASCPTPTTVDVVPHSVGSSAATGELDARGRSWAARLHRRADASSGADSLSGDTSAWGELVRRAQLSLSRDGVSSSVTCGGQSGARSNWRVQTRLQEMQGTAINVARSKFLDLSSKETWLLVRPR
jgi:hypothetical protein